MRVQKLHIDAFGVLHDYQLKLGPDLTVLYGLNEAGKSTIARFLRFVLTGYSKEVADYAPTDKRKAKGRVWLEDDDGSTLVLERAMRTKTKDKLTVTDEDGAVLSPGRVERLFGAFAPEFYRSVYTCDDEELTELHSGERGAQIEQGLFKTLHGSGLGGSPHEALASIRARRDELYQPATKKMKLAIPEAATQLQSLENQIEQLRDKAALHEDHREELQKTRAELEQVSGVIGEARASVSRLEARHKLREPFSELVSAQRKLEGFSRDLDTFPENGMSRLEDLLGKIERQESELDTRLRSVEQMRTQVGVSAGERQVLEREPQIEALVRESGSRIDRRREGERLREELDRLARQIETLAREVGVEKDPDQVHALPLDLAHERELTQAAQRLERTEEKLEETTREHEETHDRLPLARTDPSAGSKSAGRSIMSRGADGVALAACLIGLVVLIAHGGRGALFGVGVALLILCVLVLGAKIVWSVLGGSESRSLAADEDRSALNIQLESLTAKLARIREQRAQQRARLDQACESLGLDQGLEPALAREMTAGLSALADHLRAQKQSREKRADIEKQSERFQSRLTKAYVGACGSEDPASSWEQMLAQLERALTDARELRVRRLAKKERLGVLEEALPDLRARLVRAQSERDRLLEAGGADGDVEIFRRRARLSGEWLLALREYENARNGFLGGARAAFNEDDPEALLKRVGTLDWVALEEELREGIDEVGLVEDRISSLQILQGKLTQEIGDLERDERLAGLLQERADLRDKLLGLVERFDLLGLAIRLMEEVCAIYDEQRQPVRIRLASEHLRLMTEDRYNLIRENTDGGQDGGLRVRFHDESWREVSRLSRGTHDQLYLALRLAMVGEIREEAQGLNPPLILDDLLVRFDDERGASAVRLLSEYAKNHQVLYFTAHTHLLDGLSAAGATVLKLERI